MPGLLDLPPEIRVMIFKPLVVSSTSCLQPISGHDIYRCRFPGRFSPSGPLFCLAIRRTFEANEYLSYEHPQNVPGLMSLSLLRVCRVMYQEISEIFWKSNTFIFTEPSVLRYKFEGMRKLATCRITSIRLFLTAVSFEDPEFRSIADTIARGSLQQLDLVLPKHVLTAFVLMRSSYFYKEDLTKYKGFYGVFLRTLKGLSKLQVRKRLIIVGDRRYITNEIAQLEGIIHEIQEAFRDQICWSDG